MLSLYCSSPLKLFDGLGTSSVAPLDRRSLTDAVWCFSPFNTSVCKCACAIKVYAANSRIFLHDVNFHLISSQQCKSKFYGSSWGAKVSRNHCSFIGLRPFGASLDLYAATTTCGPMKIHDWWCQSFCCYPSFWGKPYSSTNDKSFQKRCNTSLF